MKKTGLTAIPSLANSIKIFEDKKKSLSGKKISVRC